jgi:type IV fimbrial biogenesis protein FimT
MSSSRSNFFGIFGMWYRALAVPFPQLPCSLVSRSVASRAGVSTDGTIQTTSRPSIRRRSEAVAAMRPHSHCIPYYVQCRVTAGFTMIELMIGLTVAALLFMMSAPSFSDFMRNSEIRSTTESIINGLRVARSEAANRNEPVRFTLAGGGSPSWSINQVSDNSLIQNFSKQEGGANISVSIQPPGASAITFNGLGRIIPAAGMGQPNLQQLDISSVLAASARPLRIYVDDGHGLHACDPSPVLAALAPRDARAC